MIQKYENFLIEKCNSFLKQFNSDPAAGISNRFGAVDDEAAVNNQLPAVQPTQTVRQVFVAPATNPPPPPPPPTRSPPIQTPLRPQQQQPTQQPIVRFVSITFNIL